MNHFKRISYSRNSWCQLKRLQSSVSTSNGKIEIPSRIERGPTDILNALDSTVPRDALRTSYKYHDDPFLLPSRKSDCRSFPLSYESGVKTAMWIHKEHREYFPKDLADPAIKAFQPPVVYTDKSQVSEEVLLQVIADCNPSDAISVYRLLEDDISTETKLALFQLLCFFNGDSYPLKALVHERWVMKTREKKFWSNNPEIMILYKDLTRQDPATAAAAHNTMICGFAKWGKADEAWLTYEKCLTENIPLNVHAYNYIIGLISKVMTKDDLKKKEMLNDVFASMNQKGIRPNVKTLNNALSVAECLTDPKLTEDLLVQLMTEFKRLNIKFSLGSYYYAIRVFSRTATSTREAILQILKVVEKGSFTIEDVADTKFFCKAMDVACRILDKNIGHMIHKIFLKENNHHFIINSMQESGYYFAYTMLILKSSSIEEFFEFYRTIVPSVYIPEMHVVKNIVYSLKFCSPQVIAKYLPRFWADMVTFGASTTPVGFEVMDLMILTNLPADSPSTPLFADAAWSIWNYIKAERQKENFEPFKSSVTSNIALLLLRDDRIEGMGEVIKEMVNNPSVFVPNLSKDQLNELFENCVSKNCIPEALLLLEYSINLGFEHTVGMAKSLYNNPELNDDCRNKLIELVGNEALQTMSSTFSSSDKL